MNKFLLGTAVMLSLTFGVQAQNEDVKWEKHKRLNTLYGECIKGKLPELDGLSFEVGQPKGARNRLKQLQKQVADHDTYFERNAVKKKKPYKLFRRARHNAEISLDIMEMVNWQKRGLAGKTILVHMQMCFLSYHRDLRDSTYYSYQSLADEDSISDLIHDSFMEVQRQRQVEQISELAEYKGVSKDVVSTASIVRDLSSKEKKPEPWSETPKFFDSYTGTLSYRFGKSFDTKDLKRLDSIVGDMLGVKNACECFSKIESRSVHKGFCASVADSKFGAVVTRYEILLQQALQAGSRVSPALQSDDKDAKVRISDFPDFASHVDLINAQHRADADAVLDILEQLRQTLLIYLKRGESEALSCSVSAMSRGRTY